MDPQVDGGAAVSGARASRPTGRDEVSEAILASAEALFSERTPSKVSVREIARRAGVNHGLVHRHFGSREDLLVAVFRRAQARASELVGDTSTVVDAVLALKARRSEGETYAQMLALALMDGADPATFHGRSDAFSELAERVAEEGRAGGGRRRGGGDPRQAVATAMVMFLGWNVFHRWAAVAAGLDPDEDDEFYDEFCDRIIGLLAQTMDDDLDPER